MVIIIRALKSRNYKHVYEDIKAVVEASHGNIVKVILETVLLNDEEKIVGAFLSAEEGVAFVKTCTGFCAYCKAIKEGSCARECREGEEDLCRNQEL